MLLGKRPRPPMRRTTSMSEFGGEASGRSQKQSNHVGGGAEGLEQRYLTAMVSPRNPRRNSGDFAVELGHFLKTCGLCRRRLAPGKDIYMYRGEIAFCSLECRQQQMTLDERKEKCSVTSIKNESPPSTSTTESSGSGGETVAAA